jgi:hypothetical protein
MARGSDHLFDITRRLLFAVFWHFRLDDSRAGRYRVVFFNLTITQEEGELKWSELCVIGQRGQAATVWNPCQAE